MAKNGLPYRNERWKERLRVSMLINLLIDNATGKKELNATQVRSIEIVLKKLVPDLKSVTLSTGDLTTYEDLVTRLSKDDETRSNSTPTN